MVICGLIVEYNPFHNGHLYHIEQARKLTNCDVLIVIMSPTFMQRGEPAIINKFVRTQVALEYGVDLVVELPSIYALASANYFADGALDLLNQLKVTDIVFGSELNDLVTLEKHAQISNQLEYQVKVKEYLKSGQRYANACNQAFHDYGLNDIKDANDILGLAYLQSILKHNYPIKAHTIKRTNAFLSEQIQSEISSASAIRHALYHHMDIKQTTPMAELLVNSDELVFLDDFFTLLKYQLNIQTVAYLQHIHGVKEGLEYLFKKHINEASDMNDFINKVASKRYPKTRIQRIIMYILLNLTQEEAQEIKPNYIRVLGMNDIGQTYLKKIKNKTEYQIITRFAEHNHPALAFEQRVTNLYSLAKKSVNYLAEKEYQQPVIMMELKDCKKKNR